MQRGIYARRELYDKIVHVVMDVLGDSVVGIVLFGSTVYMGQGRDLDLLVVLDREVDVGEKLRLEYELSRRLREATGGLVFDIHVMGLESFVENLVPGGFLSGLALGYEVLVDRGGVEDRILEFLERLARERYVLHNRYGSWDLGFYARITLRMKRRSRGG